MSYNKLLARQIRKHLPEHLHSHPEMADFLLAINDSYQAYEKDKSLAERAFSISESEYIEITQRLKEELQLKTQSVRKIKDAMSLLGEKGMLLQDDIGILTDQLYNQVVQASRNEEAVNSLMTSYQTGILFEDPSGNIQLVNQPFCDLFLQGISPNEVMESERSAITSKIIAKIADAEDLVSNTIRIREAREMVTGNTIRLIDGRILERNYVPVFEKDSFKGHLWSFNDITEKKLLEEALVREKTFNEEILNNLPSDVAVFDMNHRYLFVNPMGIKNPELRKWIIGKDDFEYCEMRGRDPELAVKRREVFNKVVDTKTTVEYIDSMLMSDGKTTHTFRRFYPLMKNGELQYVIGYGVDVTSMVEAEETVKRQKNFYESMLDRMPIDVGVIDHELRFVYLNKKAVKRDEIREWLIGKTEQDFVEKTGKGSELTSKREEMMRAAMAKGETQQWRETYREGAPDEMHVLRTISPYEGINKEKYLLATGSDVTAIALAEKELTRNNEALQKTNSELDRFVYSTSHDLRAPLTSVLGLIRIIEMNLPAIETKQHDRIRMVKDSVRKLDDFIAEILDYSRNARSEINAECIQIESLINEVRGNLNYMDGSSEFMLHLDIEPGIQMRSDKRRIKVVLSNIISNAIKYQDKNKPERSLQLKFQNMNNGIEIIAKDNGIGISENNLEHIFEMFYRATSLSTGSGLGLYIVKETVDKLGGTIDVCSTPAEGSTFTLFIPNIA
ncbi:MAG: ATP-binding protein [Arcticibacter sp.]